MHVSLWKFLPLYPMYGLQVSVSLSANETMPGDPVTLRVQGEKGSCVCVATVDKSLYLLKPDFQLSPVKVSPVHCHLFVVSGLVYSSVTPPHPVTFRSSRLFPSFSDFSRTGGF